MLQSAQIVPQTVYGAKTRYEWMRSFLKKEDIVFDIGCGTGLMLTIPLIKSGFNVVGVDTDFQSILYGKKLLISQGISDERLICSDLKDINACPDVIILSEILEHLYDDQLDELLQLCWEKLKPGGLLLITVPNGYGAYEIEDFLWFKCKIGKLINFLKIDCYYTYIKNKMVGYNTVITQPSSLDSSPHVQFFTLKSLIRKLNKHNYRLVEKKGNTLVSGPFSDMLFTGFEKIMKLNEYLGKCFPTIAAGFFVAVRKCDGR